MKKPSDITEATWKKIGLAADAAGISKEKFMSRINGLLRHRKCRDTDGREQLFSAPVLDAISCAL